MTISADAQIVGLTGPFGSGCSTAAYHIRHERGFLMLKLSDVVRGEWNQNHPGEPPTRPQLQDLGNQIRAEHGPGELARRAVEALAADPELVVDRLVVDGIRNVGELEFLKRRFGYSFTLLAIMSSPDDRWARIGDSSYHD